MCGVVLKDRSFVQFENLSDKPTMSFKMDIRKYLDLENEVEFIIHSHTQRTHIHPQTPSVADIELHLAFKKPLLICALKDSIFLEPIRVPPVPSKEYLNRPYIFGVSDCGVLTQDYYLFEFDIKLTRDIHTSLYERKKWAEAVRKFLTDNEFIETTKTHPLQKGDILVTHVFGGKDNHAMLYTGARVLNQAEYSVLNPLEQHLSTISSIYRHPLLMT
jgi:hypothetical protein